MLIFEEEIVLTSNLHRAVVGVRTIRLILFFFFSITFEAFFELRNPISRERNKKTIMSTITSFDIGEFGTLSREQLVYLARTAEASERFEGAFHVSTRF